MAVDREVVFSAGTVQWAAEQLGLTLPVTLAPEPVWRSADAEAAHAATARSELAEEGLLDHRDAVGEDLEESLRLLCRGRDEVSAYVQTEDLTYRLHAAGGRRTAAFACYLPRERRILLRPARPEALARTVVLELPECAAGRASSLSVPVSELKSPEPRGDARRVAAIFARPRSAAGQLYAGVRSDRGRRRSEPVTFVDTDQGRWLSHCSADGRFVTTVPGTPDALLVKLAELRNALAQS